ncbi:hypothetical protein NDY24_11365 [Xanthomonas hortorum pv. pelargonii]|nr:hypothetical protein NDY24_11365 [Xanthomonas hortorum pv. pelargonii]
MKLTAAQILSTPGQIEENISKHLDVIQPGGEQGADVLVFPELPSPVTNPDWRRPWRCSRLISALINFR